MGMINAKCKMQNAGSFSPRQKAILFEMVCVHIGALGATPHPSRLRVPPSPKVREKADL